LLPIIYRAKKVIEQKRNDEFLDTKDMQQNIKNDFNNTANGVTRKDGKRLHGL